VAITVSQDGQDPNIPIRLPGLDGPFSTLRIEEQFLAARTRIELPEPERKSCTALFSAKLNWIVNMTCGKFSTDLVGYTADGISHGITYLEAAGELQQLYVRDRVARQAKLAALKRESAQLISQREAELAQQRAEAEAQSRDLVQNLLRTAAIAAGTAVQGLQQSQAVKQGIPPTVNIVPEQGIGEAGMDGDPYGGMVVGGETYDAGAGLGNLRDVGLDGGTAYGGVPTAEGVNSGEILRAGSACPVNMMHLIPRMRSKLTFWGPSIWGPDRTCQACDKGFSSDIPAQIKQWGTEGLLSGLKWQNESEKDPEWIMVRGEAAKAVRCWQQTGAHPATASTEAPDGEKAQFDRERDRMLERMESQRPAVKPSAPSRPPIPNYEERPPCSRQPCTTK
jgi:hypothetical protein